MKNIYSAFFVEGQPYHITWEFNPGGCALPEGVKEGDEVTLNLVGFYSDKEAACFIVEVILNDGTVLTHQESGTLLHVTTRAEGASPVQSGLRATASGYRDCKGFPPVKAIAGFFRA